MMYPQKSFTVGPPAGTSGCCPGCVYEGEPHLHDCEFRPREESEFTEQVWPPVAAI